MEINLKSLFQGISAGNYFDDYPDAVFIINQQQDIIFLNKRAQEIFEFAKKEIINRNIELIFNNNIERIDQSLAENKKYIINAVTKSGREILTEISCSEISSSKEIIIALRDVTQDQKGLRNLLKDHEKVININKNKDSFIVNLSHELTSPLQSITGFSQSLLDGISGSLSEKQKKYLSIIYKNAASLQDLLNNVIDLSKIEAGKMEFELKKFDVVRLINSIEEIVKASAKKKNLEFSIDLSDIIKRNVFSDENALKQVLLNVLTNAVKFTEVGSIQLKVIHPDLEFLKYQGMKFAADSTDKSYLMFSVSDTGIGIAENELNDIFDKYKQNERVMSKKYGGTGLGLALSKKILQELNGIIWVESELSEGSTFSFIIPIDRLEISE